MCKCSIFVSRRAADKIFMIWSQGLKTQTTNFTQILSTNWLECVVGEHFSFRQDNQSTRHMLHINMLVRQRDYCAGVPQAGGAKRSEQRRSSSCQYPSAKHSHGKGAQRYFNRTTIDNLITCVCEGGCDAPTLQFNFMATSSAASRQFGRNATSSVQRKRCFCPWNLENVLLSGVERSWTLEMEGQHTRCVGV